MKTIFTRLLSFLLSFLIAFSPAMSYAQGVFLPAPGIMVDGGPAYVPVIFKGLSVHPENPLLFDFIVDTGNSGLKPQTSDDLAIKKESDKLIKYFLASLTISEKNQWVNLSPYEKDRILPEELGKTELGRDMLAQDYLLKQVTASLIHPAKELGHAFWSRVYERARKEFGTTDIPVDTFNKVWISAEKADVYVKKNTVFIAGSHLKVMLESDYLAAVKAQGQQGSSIWTESGSRNEGNSEALRSQAELTKQIVREIVIPELEKEVNIGKNFANLRQIFHSMILATWYKKNLKEALLTQVYANQGKTGGVEGAWVSQKGSDVDPEQIWAKYEEAYKTGVFNFIKEDVDQTTGETTPHKYFSGGVTDLAMAHVVNKLPQGAEVPTGKIVRVTMAARNAADKIDLAMKDRVVNERMTTAQGEINKAIDSLRKNMRGNSGTEKRTITLDAGVSVDIFMEKTKADAKEAELRFQFSNAWPALTLNRKALVMGWAYADNEGLRYWYGDNATTFSFPNASLEGTIAVNVIDAAMTGRGITEKFGAALRELNRAVADLRNRPGITKRTVALDAGVSVVISSYKGARGKDLVFEFEKSWPALRRNGQVLLVGYRTQQREEDVRMWTGTGNKGFRFPSVPAGADFFVAVHDAAMINKFKNGGDVVGLHALPDSDTLKGFTITRSVGLVPELKGPEQTRFVREKNPGVLLSQTVKTGELLPAVEAGADILIASGMLTKEEMDNAKVAAENKGKQIGIIVGINTKPKDDELSVEDQIIKAVTNGANGIKFKPAGQGQEAKVVAWIESTKRSYPDLIIMVAGDVNKDNRGLFGNDVIAGMGADTLEEINPISQWARGSIDAAMKPEALERDVVKLMKRLNLDNNQRFLTTMNMSVDTVLIKQLADNTGKSVEEILPVLEGIDLFKPIVALYRMRNPTTQLQNGDFQNRYADVTVSDNYTFQGEKASFGHENHELFQYLKSMGQEAGNVPFVFRDNMKGFVGRFLGLAGVTENTTGFPDLQDIVTGLEAFLSKIDIGKTQYLITSGIGANEMYSHQLAALLKSLGITWIVVNNPDHMDRIPQAANSENTIVFEMSRSGTTQETFDFFQRTKDRFTKRVVAAVQNQLRTAGEELGKKEGAVVYSITDIPGYIGGRQMNRKTLMVAAPLFLALAVGYKDVNKAEQGLKQYFQGLYDANEELSYNNQQNNPAVNLSELLLTQREVGRKTVQLLFSGSIKGLANETYQLANEGAQKYVAGGYENNNLFYEYNLNRPEDVDRHKAALEANPDQVLPFFLLDKSSEDYDAMKAYADGLKAKGLPAIVITVDLQKGTSQETVAHNLRTIARTSALMQDFIVYFTYLTKQDANSNPAVKLVRELTNVAKDFIVKLRQQSGENADIRMVISDFNEAIKISTEKKLKTAQEVLAKTGEFAVEAQKEFKPMQEAFKQLAEKLGVSEEEVVQTYLGAVTKSVMQIDVGEAANTNTAMIEAAFGLSELNNMLGVSSPERAITPVTEQVKLEDTKDKRVSIGLEAGKSFEPAKNVEESLAQYLYQSVKDKEGVLDNLVLTFMERDEGNPTVLAIANRLAQSAAKVGLQTPVFFLPGRAHSGIEGLMARAHKAFNISIVYTEADKTANGKVDIGGLSVNDATYMYGISNVIRMFLGGSRGMVFEVKNDEQLKSIQDTLNNVLDKFDQLAATGMANKDKAMKWSEVRGDVEKWIPLAQNINMADINKDMFRDYDYRYVKDGMPLSPEIVFMQTLVWARMALQKAAAAGIKTRDVLIARDARKIEPEIVDAEIAALRYAGLNVVFVGDEPNSVTSYSWAVQSREWLMTIFNTASHVAQPDGVVDLKDFSKVGADWEATLEVLIKNGLFDRVAPQNDKIKIMQSMNETKERLNTLFSAEKVESILKVITPNMVVRGFKVTQLGLLGGNVMSLSTKEIKDTSLALLQEFLSDKTKIEAMKADQPGGLARESVEADAIRFNTAVALAAANNESLYALGQAIKESGNSKAVVNALLERLGQNKPLAGMSVVVEGSHTPSGPIAAGVFQNLGARVEGLNLDVQEVSGLHKADPSIEKNLEGLKARIIETRASFGIAFDLDGDRGAILIPEWNADGSLKTFHMLAPDNLLGVLMPDLLQSWGYKDSGKKVGVIRDVLGTYGVNDFAKEQGVEMFQTDAGYVYLKAKKAEMEPQGYVFPVYGERSGHTWLHVSGEIENPVAVAVLFATIVNREKSASDTNGILQVYQGRTVPYSQSPRFQPFYHPSLLQWLSENNTLGWKYVPGVNPPQAIVALGKDQTVAKLGQAFPIGKFFGEYKVAEFNTYRDSPEEGGLYRFADIMFEKGGKFVGRVVVRASSNDPTFVMSYEAPVLGGQSLEEVASNRITASGLVMKFMINEGLGIFTRGQMRELMNYLAADKQEVQFNKSNLGPVEADYEEFTTLEAKTAQETPAVKRNTVLVVDDEASLRDITKEMLQVSYPGVNVITAKNGAEAIALLEKMSPAERGSLAAVYSDTNMPEKNGFAVAEYVAKNLPVEVKYVAKSGMMSNEYKARYAGFFAEQPDRVVQMVGVIGKIKDFQALQLVEADKAMKTPGGIDLNANNMTLNQSGDALQFKFDPTVVEQFQKGNFTGITPVILNITPMQSLSPLLGLETGQAQPASV